MGASYIEGTYIYDDILYEAVVLLRTLLHFTKGQSYSLKAAERKVATSKCPPAVSMKSVCSHHEAAVRSHLVGMQALALLYILRDLKWRKPSVHLP